VELVCPEHVRGVSAAAVVIGGGGGEGVLTLRFGRGKLGPFNAPLRLRATLETKGGPVSAEAKLEIVAED
jgi:hypothetical protein